MAKANPKQAGRRSEPSKAKPGGQPPAPRGNGAAKGVSGTVLSPSGNGARRAVVDVQSGDAPPRGVMAEFSKLVNAGRLNQAAALLEKVVAEEPDNAQALQNLGAVYARLERMEKARPLLERAVALAPDMPMAHHNLGSVLSKLGEIEEADRLVRRAIELSPGYGEAYHALANLSQGTAGAEYVPQIEKALRAKDVDDHNKRYLNFAAGHFLHRLKRYDEAFQHYVAANRARGAEYDPKVFDGALREARAAFPPAIFDRANADRPGRHVFVVGLPRSGTTLVEQILSSHPAVAAAGEMPDIPMIAGTLPKFAEGDAKFPGCLAALPDEAFKGLARSYHARVREVAGDAEVHVDKNPYNFIYLGLINLLLPDAVVVHCRRHPLDTALSCFMQNFTIGNEFTFSMATIGHYYRFYERMMAHWEGVVRLPIHTVDHRYLVADFETEARRLIAAVGLEWDDACLRYYENKRIVHTASSEQVRRPLTGEGVNRWRHYAAHIRPMIDAMWPEAAPPRPRRVVATGKVSRRGD
jgi:tetratricopeptide (TPR) repeat protein